MVNACLNTIITEGYEVRATTIGSQNSLAPPLNALRKLHVIEGQTRLIRFRDYIRAVAGSSVRPQLRTIRV